MLFMYLQTPKVSFAQICLVKHHTHICVQHHKHLWCVDFPPSTSKQCELNFTPLPSTPSLPSSLTNTNSKLNPTHLYKCSSCYPSPFPPPPPNKNTINIRKKITPIPIWGSSWLRLIQSTTQSPPLKGESRLCAN